MGNVLPPAVLPPAVRHQPYSGPISLGNNAPLATRGFQIGGDSKR